MFKVLSIISPLFIIIFVSAIFQRAKNVDESWSKVLNDYALKIGLPALIFSALSKAVFSLSAEKNIILANSVFLLGSFLLTYIASKLFRLSKQLSRTAFMCVAFGNVAYLGIPILIAVNEKSVLPTVSLIVAIYLFWKFTIGLGYLDYTRETKRADVMKTVIKQLVKNPILIAVVLGIIVGSLQIPIPDVLSRAIDMIIASTTPTVLVVIGLFVGKSRIGKLAEWLPILLFSLLVLLALPALFYAGIRIAGYAPHDFSVSIIEAAMPLAITPFALADKYDLDKTFIARSIVLSTILSVISIPFWISVL